MMTVTIPLYVLILIFYVLPVIWNVILLRVGLSVIEFEEKYHKNLFTFTPILNLSFFVLLLYDHIKYIKDEVGERYFFYKRRKRQRLEDKRMMIYKISHGIIRYNELDPYGEENWE